MECRLAQEGDAQAVVDLWCQLIQFYGEHFSHYGGELDQEALKASFFHMHKGESFRIMVVENPQVVGTCTLHLNRFSSWSQSFYGTLEDLVVHQDWQGQGLGGALLTYAREVAQRENLSRLELHVLAENRLAQTLYQKQGYTFADSLVYSILLPKEEE